jgi:Kdo2-lipid IVA lauroyltransferase/acyltransferase
VLRTGWAARAFDAALGRVTVWALKLARRIRRAPLADLGGWIMRRIGPRLKEHEIGRANLVAAFPEKSADEIDAILDGVWDNLGRVGAEFAHIDHLRILEPDQPARNPDGVEPEAIVYEQNSYARVQRLRFDGKPALLFTAHLANWELPAYVATAGRLPLTVLYRRLKNTAVNDAVLDIRTGTLGTLVATGLDAPIKLRRALGEGSHVAMVVDQHLSQGVDVTFFGRPCKANPLIAWLARDVEYPIHGARTIRLPDRNRFCVEITEAIEPERDANGRIQLQGTMQRITDVVEGWVREYPEQWLWVHRRWR